MRSTLSKFELAKLLIYEVANAQNRPVGREHNSPFPPMLWIGDGRAFKASNHAYDLIRSYAKIHFGERADLSAAVAAAEVANTVARAAAIIIDTIGLPNLASQPAQDISSQLDHQINILLEDKILSQEYYFGCTFLRGSGLPKIVVGPVSFDGRENWLDRLVTERNLPIITARRIRAKWQGKRLRERKSGHDSIEKSLVDCAGDAPFIATVCMFNQYDKVAASKAMLLARLAMTAVALNWNTPSIVLNDISLIDDGNIFSRQHVTNFAGSYGFSYTSSGSKTGHYIDKDLIIDFVAGIPMLDQVVNVLEILADPKRESNRPRMLKTLFMSLWWFHEAYREKSGLFAITKFCSSLDSLTGGARAPGIKALIESRLGREPKLAWFKDGRTPNDVIHELYEITRNQAIHGSIKTFDHDWSGPRQTAEFIARQCLTASLVWAGENQNSDSPKDLLKP